MEQFRFRQLEPDILLGTASDRYGGWIGQIYTEERYAGRIERRTRKIHGTALVSQVLPVECVSEYFEHFPVLELDFTFYGPLLNTSGAPTKSYHTLREYSQHTGPEDRLLIKAPQMVFARKLWRKGKFLLNPDYLDADLFVRRFYEPALELLGARLKGVIFEQEYRKKQDRIGVAEMARELDAFFGRLPPDEGYHVELRTDAFLREPVFDVLAARGVGQVFSHWTWLPRLRDQFEKSGRRFLNSGGDAIIRLLTPLNVRYEDAFKKAHPFDALIEEMITPAMIDDSVKIARAARANGVRANLIINNRAAGNAPLLALLLARKLQEEKSSTSR